MKKKKKDNERNGEGAMSEAISIRGSLFSMSTTVDVSAESNSQQRHIQTVAEKRSRHKPPSVTNDVMSK